MPRRKCQKCRKAFPATTRYFTLNARLPGGITRRCKRCAARYMKRWYWKNRKKALAHAKRWRIKNREQARAITARGRKRLRDEFFARYGMHCKCCGEDERAFLTVEHVGGGGTADRRKSGGTHMILLRLKKQGWPQKGWSVLCHNCQFGERIGGCPHKHKRSR